MAPLLCCNFSMGPAWLLILVFALPVVAPVAITLLYVAALISLALRPETPLRGRTATRHRPRRRPRRAIVAVEPDEAGGDPLAASEQGSSAEEPRPRAPLPLVRSGWW